MDKDINSNGYKYVDLDLPSGTVWATCNIGASKPSDGGLYFQWGDTKGYALEQISDENGQKEFLWGDYKWNANRSDLSFSKYTIRGATLESEDDAAHVNMGGDWHMPTDEQIQELIDNTIREWTILDEVKGVSFTSKKNDSKSIFIPAASSAWNCSVDDIGIYGCIWSSMLNKESCEFGQILDFHPGVICLHCEERSDGIPVRGVIDKKSDNSKEKKEGMNEKLNLVEILKDAPKGTKLWSSIYGECTFLKVDTTSAVHKNYPIVCKETCFSEDGKLLKDYPDAECVLFPSKENRDWSTFKVQKKHKHFKSFQKVLRIDDNNPDYKIWTSDFYSHYEETTGKHYLTSGFIMDDVKLPTS